MQYLTIEEIKQQCVIDPDFNDDDTFLEAIGDAAEDFVAQMIDQSLDEVAAITGDLPPVIRHAMRMMCDYFYAVNRGSADTGKDIPNAVFTMLKLYRSY